MRFYGGEITSHFWKFDRTSELLVSPREKSRCHRGHDPSNRSAPGSTFPRWDAGLALAHRFSKSGKLYLPRCSRGKHRDAENRNRAKLLARDARANKDALAN